MRARLLLPFLTVAAFLAALVTACADPPSAPERVDPSIAMAADLDERIAALPGGPERVALEIERATVGIRGMRHPADRQARLADAIASLRRLVDEKVAAGDVDAEAQVRVAFGRHFSMLGDRAAAAAEFDRVLESAATSPYAAAALTEKASNLYRGKDYAGCKALLERVRDEFPGTPDAESAPAGIANCDRELAR